MCDPIFHRRLATLKMNAKPKFLVIAAIAAFATGSAHISGGGLLPLQATDPQIYCGRNLARALALLCYDESSASKRSDSASMYDGILPYYKNQELQMDWLWMTPHKAKSLMYHSRGKRYPGVVNECCDKACSIKELLTYC
ncbi:unnamed protein product [Chilo suppressalis]|uniref:Insulin-like domain-containing protein n=1 Tax=Chilo suppressalis TaxID=168631 RepID=A0ABN8AXC7_CHISP|nr:hypothetical protein evm_013901 [Chilo suppressalis]CAH0397385.1 unnamed protein product [Chilo suppressalis]